MKKKAVKSWLPKELEIKLFDDIDSNPTKEFWYKESTVKTWGKGGPSTAFAGVKHSMQSNPNLCKYRLPSLYSSFKYTVCCSVLLWAAVCPPYILRRLVWLLVQEPCSALWFTV